MMNVIGKFLCWLGWHWPKYSLSLPERPDGKVFAMIDRWNCTRCGYLIREIIDPIPGYGAED